VVEASQSNPAAREYQFQWADFCCRRWVLGVEYLRVKLDEKTHETVSTRHVSQEFDLLRARFSYKFGQTSR
jgi:hypothetical protein